MRVPSPSLPTPPPTFVVVCVLDDNRSNLHFLYGQGLGAFLGLLPLKKLFISFVHFFIGSLIFFFGSSGF
jgi:hypothetical protein